MDQLPPPPPPAHVATPTVATPTLAAPTDIYPRSDRERELCDRASRPDLLYMGGLLVLDVGAIWFGSSSIVKYANGNDWDVALRTIVGPGLIGTTWGATITGTWLALPKCEPHWIGETPREGDVRSSWPVAISLAVLAGVTAPIINGIAIGTCFNVSCYYLPLAWSTLEREAHIFVAGVSGFGGALLPFVLPPSTLRAARELDRLRFSYDGRNAYLGYVTSF